MAKNILNKIILVEEIQNKIKILKSFLCSNQNKLMLFSEVVWSKLKRKK